MDQKPFRFVGFFALAFGLMMLWQSVVLPRFLPQFAPQAKNAANKAKEGDKPAAGHDAGKGAVVEAKPGDPAAAGDKKDADPAKGDKPDPWAFAKHPTRVLKLGSIEPNSPYRLDVSLSTRGAAISEVTLNSPKYRDLKKRDQPLRIIRPGFRGEQTFAMTLPQVPVDLREIDWEVIEEAKDAVAFRLATQVPGFEIVKRYAVKPLPPDATHETEGPGYLIDCSITLKNTTEGVSTWSYELQGPVGMPLENADNTTKWRDVAAGFREPTYINTVLLPSSTIAKGGTETWSKPFAFIGVDVQFFAGLLFPVGKDADWFLSAAPTLVGLANSQFSDVSVRLESKPIALQPGGEVAHKFQFFAGPKDEHLLPTDAAEVIQHGRLGWISRPMVSFLKFLYALVGNYGIAIIGLTILVRAAMLPLSLRQAKNAMLMQEVQKKIAPEMALIKQKYPNDQARQSQEMMELYRKYNFNPFSMLGGCLLLFVQLPVFMALYSALNLAVDLRQAPFLWVHNLAAPDALFAFPFTIPLLGWTEFNLLPLISVALMVVQQEMFMPPPTNEEQALQQKMMKYMTIGMGVLFYRVPAGLCVYFIASGIWGLIERKLLPKPNLDAVAATVAAAPPPPAAPSTGGTQATASPAGPGLWERLVQMADKDQQIRREPTDHRSTGRGGANRKGKRR
jgi:YidC/Oxa1 family membrane protein insertase